MALFKNVWAVIVWFLSVIIASFLGAFINKSFFP